MIGKRKAARRERMTHDGDSFRIETHQDRASCVDAGCIDTENEQARGDRVGIHRPTALASYDTVNKTVVAPAVLLGWLADRAVRISIKRQFVQVETHSPNRIVARPVAAA